MKASCVMVLTFTVSIIFFIIVLLLGKCKTEASNTLYVSKTVNGNYTFIQETINDANTGI